MRALIYEMPEHVGVGWVDIAGRPLLMRQIQWLRDAGIEDVVVELCVGPDDTARGSWLLGDDPILFRVQVLPTAAPVGPDELARRAGFARDERALHVPAHVIGGGPLPIDTTPPVRMTLPLAKGVQTTIAGLELRARGESSDQDVQLEGAWGACIEELNDALDVSCAALEGRAPGIMLHAREQSPGVWIARGAHVASAARVEPPVYLGLDALVVQGAQVGPRAIILDRAVIERGATVVDAMVAADTLIGENTRVRHALAIRHALVSFQDGARTSILDPLVLASRGSTTALLSRCIALVLLVALAPFWLVVAGVSRARGRPVQRVLLARGGITWRIGALGVPVVDLVPPLLDVLLGTRDLVGVAQGSVLEIAARRQYPSAAPRAGAIDISSRLAPSQSAQTVLRLWRWYAHRKTNSLDRSLLLRRDPPT